METELKPIIESIVLVVELFGVVVIVIGAIQALIRIIRLLFEDRRGPLTRQKDAWLRFGVSLLFGLEFALAADIMRTIITPTWADLGQVGAIAVIRTFLNYFLGRDLERFAEENNEPGSIAGSWTKPETST